MSADRARQVAEIPRGIPRGELRQLVEGLPAPAVAQRLVVTGDDNQDIRNVGNNSTFNVRGRGGA